MNFELELSLNMLRSNKPVTTYCSLKNALKCHSVSDSSAINRMLCLRPQGHSSTWTVPSMPTTVDHLPCIIHEICLIVAIYSNK